MNIKLVATDIDGTLIQEGTHKIDPEIFEIVEKLKEKGIVFAAASGRQYCSIARLFEPVRDQMIFVAENGGYVTCRGTDVVKAVMDIAQVRALIRDLRKIPGGCVSCSAKNGIYVEDKDPAFLELMIHGYHNVVYQVSDLLEVTDEPLKISLYLEQGIEDWAARLTEKWSGEFSCTIAGDIWLDFMSPGADKGTALRSIQKALGISEEETMAFGDNLNDIPMLRCAKYSYAVANAREEVQAAAAAVTGSFADNGVLQVLRQLIG